MNAITNTPTGMVEILDAEGNPTGEFRTSETTSATTTFIAEDSGHHII